MPLAKYSASSDQVQYDLNTAGTDKLGKLVNEGDKFGYDYDIMVHKGSRLEQLCCNHGSMASDGGW